MRTLVSVLLLLGAAPGLAHDPWTEACRQAVVDYAYFRDRPDPDGVAALFTEDGTFTFQGDTWRGAESIRARVAAGVGGPVFRHLMSTIRIEQTGSRTASGVSYVTVYIGSPGSLPRKTGTYRAIGEYHDEFVRAGDRCLIRARAFVPVLEPEEG